MEDGDPREVFSITVDAGITITKNGFDVSQKRYNPPKIGGYKQVTERYRWDEQTGTYEKR